MKVVITHRPAFCCNNLGQSKIMAGSWEAQKMRGIFSPTLWPPCIVITMVMEGVTVTVIFPHLSSELWLVHPFPPLDNIRIMVIVWRFRGNITRTALCWIVWHNVHSQQHTCMSSSYRFNRLGLSHWDPYAVRRGGCLDLYYCNMVEWFLWDSSLILTTNWFPSVLWHCWFGHLASKNHPQNDLLCVEWDVKPLHCLRLVFSRPGILWCVIFLSCQ